MMCQFFCRIGLIKLFDQWFVVHNIWCQKVVIQPFLVRSNDYFVTFVGWFDYKVLHILDVLWCHIIGVRCQVSV